MGIAEDAYRYAVKNAAEHDGNASIQAVIGKIMALHPGVQVKAVIGEIQAAVQKANGLTSEELQAEFQKFAAVGFELQHAEEKEKTLPELEWARKENVITRFAPNPNGPIHFGHARAAILSHDLARKYAGKFFLRFDDTDPKVKKSIKNAEEIFRRDLEWLGIKIDAVYFASDRLELYYAYLKKLLGMGNAYVCHCSPEKWQTYVQQKKACPDRDRETKENLVLFEKMLSHTLKEGQAIVRIKTDVLHPDPSIRDWWACRIVDRPDHPRVKSRYHVWPSYMFQSAIDDHELKVTLLLRGQEHAQNETKQRFVYDYFNWVYPHALHFGRLKLGNRVLSTSAIKQGIADKRYDGWDDVRTGTITALRRRGIQAETIRRAIVNVGVNTSDANISPEKLYDLNRKLLEERTERVPFVHNPVQLRITGGPKITAELEGVTYSLAAKKETLWVNAREIQEKKEVRLRNTYNVTITRVGKTIAAGEYTDTPMKKLPVISWVKNEIAVKILTPENAWENGIADARLKKMGPDSVVYLEKYGFCRVEKTGKTVELVFAHT